MLGNNRWENAQYNSRLQVTQVGMGTTATDTSLLKIDYNYGTSANNNGSLQGQTISFSGYSGTISQSYTYDSLNRLQSATESYAGGQSWKETFSYDRFGNRRFGSGTTTITGCATANCNPTINQANNRFDAGQGFSYDQGGNVTQDAGGQRFSYDAENHQIGFFAAGNNGSTPNATYYYDGDGKRVRKIDGARETVFVYNASGSLIAEYETNFTPAVPTTKYLTQDHLGSPRVITNQSGAIVSRHDYRAFGEEVYSGIGNRSNAQGYGQADGVRKKYTGYERDYESGLDFAQARYYNSKLGRFTSVDPLTASANLKDPQTFNRYSYAMNSPYKLTDPLGLIAEDPNCNFNCRVRSAVENGTGLSDDDAARLKMHIRASSAIGVWTVNNAGRQDDFYTRQVDDPDKQEIDSDLEETFTDSGKVRSASSWRNGFKDKDGNPMDTHFALKDGKVHSMHIFGNKAADSDDAHVYVPSGFTDVKITSKDTVVARNRKTGEVIMIAHVQVGAANRKNLRALVRRMKANTRENGSMQIGKIGGRGGFSRNSKGNKVGIHSHLTFYSSESSRGIALEYKKAQGEYGEYRSEISEHLSDFRKFR